MTVLSVWEFPGYSLSDLPAGGAKLSRSATMGISGENIPEFSGEDVCISHGFTLLRGGACWRAGATTARVSGSYGRGSVVLDGRALEGCSR